MAETDERRVQELVQKGLKELQMLKVRDSFAPRYHVSREEGERWKKARRVGKET